MSDWTYADASPAAAPPVANAWSYADAPVQSTPAPAPAPSGPERSPWDRFHDSFIKNSIDNPIGGGGLARAVLGFTHDTASVEAASKAASSEIGARQEADPNVRPGESWYYPDALGREIPSVVGGILGGIDPTYAIAPGKSVLQRIGAQGAVQGAADLVRQGIDKVAGRRDDISLSQAAEAAAGGMAFQGAGETAHGVFNGIISHKAGNLIREGASHPDYGTAMDITMGTESNYRYDAVSSAGATGRLQVMPATAAKPGYGIKASNGTAADTERVGSQLFAVHLARYDGDFEKAWAAYNDGAGNVGRAIKAHGDDWLHYLPKETRDYVAKNMGELADRSHGGTSEPRSDIASNPDMSPVDSPDEQRFQAEMTPQEAAVAPDAPIHDPSQDPDELRQMKEGRLALTDPPQPDPLGGPPSGAHGDPARNLQPLDNGELGLTESQRDPFGGLATDLEAQRNILQDYHDNAALHSGDQYTPQQATTPSPHEVTANDNQGFLRRLASDEKGSFNPFGSNDNYHDIADARKTRDLVKFSQEFREKINDRGKLMKALADKAHESGMLPYKVGDKFSTAKSRENGQAPWEVKGHYVNPKEPEQYGYRVSRGKGDNVESSTLLVSNPKGDAHISALKGKPYDRGADVAGWNRYGPLRNILNDEKGSFNPFGKDKSYDPEKDRPYQDPNHPVNRLTEALHDTKDLRANQEKMYSQERAKRFSEVSKARKAGTGTEADFHNELSKLKGELPKVDFSGVGNRFNQSDIDHLFKMIDKSPMLNLGNSLHAKTGLSKLMGRSPEGGMPTHGELEQLGKVFPKQMIAALNQGRPTSLLGQAWNTINAAKTIGDWSDLTKSNATMFLSPGYWKTIGNFVKGGFFKEKNYNAIRAATRAHPDYPLVNEMDISHTGEGGALSPHEEIFKQNLLQHVPVVKDVMKASERVYSGVANEVRDHAALRMIAKDRAVGVDVTNIKYLKAAGELINTLTGRASWGEGKFGKAMEAAMPVVSKAFWTPRQYYSWVKTAGMAANPKWWMSASPAMKQQMATGVVSLVGWTVSNLTLASAFGYEVHKNILDPLFGKYKIRDTVYDASAGRGSTLHAIASAISGSVLKDGVVQDLGDNPRANIKSRGDIVMHWMRTHATPAAGMIENEFEGKDLSHPVNAVGQPQDWTSLGEKNPLIQAATPMSLEGTLDAAKRYGIKDLQTLRTGIGDMLGIMSYTQEPREAKAGADPYPDQNAGSTGMSDGYPDQNAPKGSSKNSGWTYQ